MIHEILKNGLKEGYYLLVDSSSYPVEDSLGFAITKYKRSQILQDVLLWESILKASSPLYGIADWEYVDACDEAFPELEKLFLSLDPDLYSESEELRDIQDELLEVSYQEEAGLMWIYLNKLYKEVMGHDPDVQVRAVHKITTMHLENDFKVGPTFLSEEKPPIPDTDRRGNDYLD